MPNVSRYKDAVAAYEKALEDGDFGWATNLMKDLEEIWLEMTDDEKVSADPLWAEHVSPQLQEHEFENDDGSQV
jgi:hypothetical protein